MLIPIQTCTLTGSILRCRPINSILGLWETLACIHVIPQMSRPRVACWHGSRPNSQKTECVFRRPSLGGRKTNCGFKRPPKRTCFKGGHSLAHVCALCVCMLHLLRVCLRSLQTWTNEWPYIASERGRPSVCDVNAYAPFVYLLLITWTEPEQLWNKHLLG